MEEASYTGRSLLFRWRIFLGLFMLLVSNCEAVAQVNPVSTLSIGPASDRSGRPVSNPAAIAGGGQSMRFYALHEIPFGLTDLRSSWFGASVSSAEWALGLDVSSSGFDELNTTAMEISFGRGDLDPDDASAKVRHLPGMQVGVTLGGVVTTKGVLRSEYLSFWRVGLIKRLEIICNGTAPLARCLTVGLEVGRSPEAQSGPLAPTRMSLGATLPVAPRAGLAARWSITSQHTPFAETVFYLQPVDALGIEVGYESSRSMFFAGITLSLAAYSSHVGVSWHPVLGLSSGLSGSVHLQ